MNAQEMVTAVNNFHKNMHTWSLIYLSIKDTPVHKLKTLDDINIAWERYFAVMEGAAFYPDVLDQVTEAIQSPPLDFLNSHLYTEMKVKWNDCVQLIKAGRPDPMFTDMKNFKEQLREQERKVLEAWKADMSYDDFYGTPGQLLDTLAPPTFPAKHPVLNLGPPVVQEGVVDPDPTQAVAAVEAGALPPDGEGLVGLTDAGSGSDNTIQIVSEENVAEAIAEATKPKAPTKKVEAKKGGKK